MRRVAPFFASNAMSGETQSLPPRKERYSLAVAAGMRGVLREGYSFAKFRADLLAGLTVGIVALPLAMALAIASGVPPQYGLYTAIVAGGISAALGGARFNVSGPTAAFVVLLAPIAGKYGLAGLLLCTLMAGAILVIMGVAKLGRLIQYIPYPVTTGFTAGIAVVIGTIQLKDFFGLTFAVSEETGRQANPERYIERIQLLAQAFSGLRWEELAVGIFTLAALLLWPRVTRRVPAPLAAVTLAAVGLWALAQLVPGFADVATIGSRFSTTVGGEVVRGIPQAPPVPGLPWEIVAPGEKPPVITLELVEALFPGALAIAMLGAIESLLCAVVADGMAGTRHDPDAELFGLGVANLAAPFFGGFAATGAIARTATNIRAGAKSPVAAVIHALFLLAAVLALAPVLAYLPMAAMAALLMLVAWNMSDARHFVHLLRVAPKSDVFVLLTCFALTVIFDMVIAVGVGVVLAAMLFMRRMTEISQTRLASPESVNLDEPLPVGVLMYEIAGPLFFGAAQKAMSVLETVARRDLKIILHMGAVPAMDVTGFVALESAVKKLIKAGTFVVLADVQPQPLAVLRRGKLAEAEGRLRIFTTLHDAVNHLRPPVGSGDKVRA